MIKVLFVCLGNICRSPVAEAIFNSKVNQLNLSTLFEADSAGTASYHIGNHADHRSIEVSKKNGIALTHSARLLTVSDFAHFNLIVAMDKNNLRNINHLKPTTSKTKIVLMRQFDQHFPMTDVPDPYYGELKDFEKMYQILDKCCDNLILTLLKPNNTLLPNT